MSKQKNRATLPTWLTINGAARYSGLSGRLLQEAIRENLVVSSLVTRPGAKRGRRLINRESLDAWIEAGIGSKSDLPQFDPETKGGTDD